jgi:hypothetical protein
VKLPLWFWISMLAWVLFGLPALILGAMWNGGFDLLADPPPFFQYPYEDRSLFANASWLFAVVVSYLPLFLLPAALIARRRARKNIDASD